MYSLAPRAIGVNNRRHRQLKLTVKVHSTEKCQPEEAKVKQLVYFVKNTGRDGSASEACSVSYVCLQMIQSLPRRIRSSKDYM